MFRFLSTVCAVAAMTYAPVTSADGLKGDYLETRTCDVYTGPCFANGQVGLTGNDAMMAWNIERGSYDGVGLAGLKGGAVPVADVAGWEPVYGRPAEAQAQWERTHGRPLSGAAGLAG